MNDREIAEFVVEALQEGIVPWRYPFNVTPEFKPLFGRFFIGEPKAEADADYTELDAILAATGAKITCHWAVPKPRCERPPQDRILMPPRSWFVSDKTYHASRIHEVLHFLEQPWRVGWIGTDHQAEMVAEVGTAFLESHNRLPNDQDNLNIIKWLPAWANGIDASPAYLFNAVAQAERAVNYLLDLHRRKEAAQAEFPPENMSWPKTATRKMTTRKAAARSA